MILLTLALMRSGLTPAAADAEATDVECTDLAGICDVAAILSDRPVPGAVARLIALDFGSNPFSTEGWDSLAHMGVIEALEAGFSIRFSAMQIAQIVSLGDARDFVAEKLAKT